MYHRYDPTVQELWNTVSDEMDVDVNDLSDYRSFESLVDESVNNDTLSLTRLRQLTDDIPWWGPDDPPPIKQYLTVYSASHHYPIDASYTEVGPSTVALYHALTKGERSPLDG